MSSEKTEVILDESEVNGSEFYLGLGESAYDDEFDYAKGETIADRIEQLLKDIPGSKEARKKMTANVKRLGEKLAEADEAVFFDDFLKQTIKNIVLEAAEGAEEKRKTSDFFVFLESKGQLFAHLDETGGSSVAFFDSIKQIISKDNNEGGLLGERQVDLLEFIALTHDLPKLLGGLNAQIDPDHEVIYREVIGKYMLGKKFKTKRGEIITFGEEDVKFVKQVAGAHEDIWREDQFARQTKSLEKSSQASEETYVDRARCLFHFLDIFGNAVRFDERKVLTIVDREAFKARFIDLYQRHIKLPISPRDERDIDWTKGKVNRAEWGLHGVAGLTWTFKALESWGVKVDANLVKEVQGGILEVLKKAKSSLRDSLKSQQRYLPNETSKNNLRRSYRKVARVLAELKREIDG